MTFENNFSPPQKAKHRVTGRSAVRGQALAVFPALNRYHIASGRGGAPAGAPRPQTAPAARATACRDGGKGAWPGRAKGIGAAHQPSDSLTPAVLARMSGGGKAGLQRIARQFLILNFHCQNCHLDLTWVHY